MIEHEYKKYLNLILVLADDAIKTQSIDGSFLRGNNGPHGDKETPVRNTAYWLYTCCWLVERGYLQYKKNADLAASYLLSSSARPMNAAFWCRTNPEKDLSNGLIGQAWVIESLNYASKILERSDLSILGAEVHSLHKWNDKFHAWHLLNVDGSIGPIHGTFNQQLWFAAVGANIDNYDTGKIQAQKYLDIIENNLWLYRDGTIYHDTRSYKKPKLSNIKHSIKNLLKYIEGVRSLKQQRQRSVGYHAFNLVAFKYLNNIFPEHSLWKSKCYEKASKVHLKNSFIKELNNNKYSYSYNPVAYEYGFFLNENLQNLDKMLFEQDKVINIIDNKITVHDSYDETITKSRIYELCRMLEGINYE